MVVFSPFMYCYGDLSKEDNTANTKKCVETINKLYEVEIKNNDIYKFIFGFICMKDFIFTDCDYTAGDYER